MVSKKVFKQRRLISFAVPENFSGRARLKNCLSGTTQAGPKRAQPIVTCTSLSCCQSGIIHPFKSSQHETLILMLAFFWIIWLITCIFCLYSRNETKIYIKYKNIKKHKRKICTFSTKYIPFTTQLWTSVTALNLAGAKSHVHKCFKSFWGKPVHQFTAGTEHWIPFACVWYYPINIILFIL